MQIFKFGGASVKDAEGVKNVVNVLQKVGYTNTLIVVSAMGKTTNLLEKVVACYLNYTTNLDTAVVNVLEYHQKISNNLFPNSTHKVHQKIADFFKEMKRFLVENTNKNEAFVYDQIVPYGELLSTTIISEYLLTQKINNNWIDVRELIKTDANYRDATVNWEATAQQMKQQIEPSKLYITQGFLASDNQNNTTTLGREGSDYTAAIFAYCLNAKSVTIWKDVPGVLNADPRYFTETQLLHQISYEEAIELAFYGASVIHPKTLQPLQRKEIPLFVKSFKSPKNKGTRVSKGHLLTPLIPCFIVKKKQILISLSSIDFSFIVEKNIAEIFALLHQYKLKVGVIQNSAISFTVCIDDKFDNFKKALPVLQEKFKVTYNKNVALYTVRHYTNEAVNSLIKDKKVFVKQENRATVQLVVAE